MNLNDRLVRLTLRKIIEARDKPPTVVGSLLAWKQLPLLFLVGTLCVSILVALDLPSSVPILMAGVFLGAALRDLGIARRVVRLWPIQQELFDWAKIDALAQQLSQGQG